MSLDKDHTDQVENDIRPPMKQAVTIPASNGIVIYVSTSAFSAKRISDAELTAFAKRLTLQDDPERIAELESALKFTRDIADEEYQYQKVGTGAEVALRHIARRSREALKGKA